MADNVQVPTGEGSPEYVAYKLLFEVAKAENGLKTREAILDCYAECLLATRGRREVKKAR